MKKGVDALMSFIAILSIVIATYLVTAAAAAAWVTVYRSFLRVWA